MADSRPCAIDGCDGLTGVSGSAKGLCRRHYNAQRARKACSIEGCAGRANVAGAGRGWCGPHYQRWQRHGDPLGRPDYVNKGRSCAAESCDKPAAQRGYCSKHLTRLGRHGALDHPQPWGRAPDGQRWCESCKTYKPIAGFYVNTSRPGGRSVTCAECHRVRVAEYRKAHPEKQRAWGQQRYRRLAGRGIKGLDVAERDGWRCGICSKHIRRVHAWPHPLSLSIDHIVPLSRGGEHVLANVQAAHLSCNASKGNRGTDQLRLIG